MKTNIFLSILKFCLVFFFSTIVIGRLFFPRKLEEAVIIPASRMPVFGQVLGITWEKSGYLGPAITQKTIELADSIEESDLGVNESVVELFDTNNPKKAASEAIEKEVDKKVSQLKDLPSEMVEELKSQVRNEMYKKVCQDWLKEEKNE